MNPACVRFGVAIAWLASAGTALAQTLSWPAKPIRMVIGFPPGGGADSVVRVFAPGMERILGQPIVMDYRPGAGAVLAADHVAKSAPDGYTFHYVDSAPLTISPNLRKLGYDPLASFAPVSLVLRGGYVLVGHPSVPAQTLRELLGLARTKPDSLSFGSSGIGGSGHLAGELMAALTGARIVHVPYKGGAQSMSDLIGGQIQLLFASAPTAVPQIRAGKIRAFAVTVSERLAALPEVPTFAEEGVPGYEASVWFAMVAPAGTAPAIVTRVREALLASLAAPEVVAAIRRQGYEVATTSPAALAELIGADLAKWGKVIRDANISAE